MGIAPQTAGGGLSNSKLALANAKTGEVLSGKGFYAGDKVLKKGTMVNMSNPSGLVDGAVHVSIATIVGYGNYDTGIPQDRWVPVIVIKPGQGYYDGGNNANVAIDKRMVRGNVVKTSSLNASGVYSGPKTFTVEGEVICAGCKSISDGSFIDVSWSGNQITVRETANSGQNRNITIVYAFYV